MDHRNAYPGTQAVGMGIPPDDRYYRGPAGSTAQPPLRHREFPTSPRPALASFPLRAPPDAPWPPPDVSQSFPPQLQHYQQYHPPQRQPQPLYDQPQSYDQHQHYVQPTQQIQQDIIAQNHHNSGPQLNPHHQQLQSAPSPQPPSQQQYYYNQEAPPMSAVPQSQPPRHFSQPSTATEHMSLPPPLPPPPLPPQYRQGYATGRSGSPFRPESPHDGRAPHGAQHSYTPTYAQPPRPELPQRQTESYEGPPKRPQLPLSNTSSSLFSRTWNPQLPPLTSKLPSEGDSAQRSPMFHRLSEVHEPPSRSHSALSPQPPHQHSQPLHAPTPALVPVQAPVTQRDQSLKGLQQTPQQHYPGGWSGNRVDGYYPEQRSPVVSPRPSYARPISPRGYVQRVQSPAEYSYAQSSQRAESHGYIDLCAREQRQEYLQPQMPQHIRPQPPPPPPPLPPQRQQQRQYQQQRQQQQQQRPPPQQQQQQQYDQQPAYRAKTPSVVAPTPDSRQRALQDQQEKQRHQQQLEEYHRKQQRYHLDSQSSSQKTAEESHKLLQESSQQHLSDRSRFGIQYFQPPYDGQHAHSHTASPVYSQPPSGAVRSPIYAPQPNYANDRTLLQNENVVPSRDARQSEVQPMGSIRPERSADDVRRRTSIATLVSPSVYSPSKPAAADYPLQNTPYGNFDQQAPRIVAESRSDIPSPDYITTSTAFPNNDSVLVPHLPGPVESGGSSLTPAPAPGTGPPRKRAPRKPKPKDLNATQEPSNADTKPKRRKASSTGRVPTPANSASGYRAIAPAPITRNIENPAVAYSAGSPSSASIPPPMSTKPLTPVPVAIQLPQQQSTQQYSLQQPLQQYLQQLPPQQQTPQQQPPVLQPSQQYLAQQQEPVPQYGAASQFPSLVQSALRAPTPLPVPIDSVARQSIQVPPPEVQLTSQPAAMGSIFSSVSSVPVSMAPESDLVAPMAVASMSSSMQAKSRQPKQQGPKPRQPRKRKQVGEPKDHRPSTSFTPPIASATPPDSFVPPQVVPVAPPQVAAVVPSPAPTIEFIAITQIEQPTPAVPLVSLSTSEDVSADAVAGVIEAAPASPGEVVLLPTDAPQIESVSPPAVPVPSITPISDKETATSVAKIAESTTVEPKRSISEDGSRVVVEQVLESENDDAMKMTVSETTIATPWKEVATDVVTSLRVGPDERATSLATTTARASEELRKDGNPSIAAKSVLTALDGPKPTEDRKDPVPSASTDSQIIEKAPTDAAPTNIDVAAASDETPEVTLISEVVAEPSEIIAIIAGSVGVIQVDAAPDIKGSKNGEVEMSAAAAPQELRTKAGDVEPYGDSNNVEVAGPVEEATAAVTASNELPLAVPLQVTLSTASSATNSPPAMSTSTLSSLSESSTTGSAKSSEEMVVASTDKDSDAAAADSAAKSPKKRMRMGPMSTSAPIKVVTVSRRSKNLSSELEEDSDEGTEVLRVCYKSGTNRCR
ncbi:uncharacterized protein V1518DRAFT_8766 [Limtongia smithiae]|uniref:uncharacterized protein n=1 Tax=Limtongia smithiae TaxID=1125753 RepID=UPI0034CD9DEB